MKFYQRFLFLAIMLGMGCSRDMGESRANHKQTEESSAIQIDAKPSSQQPENTSNHVPEFEERKPVPSVPARQEPTQIAQYEIECAEDHQRGRTIVASGDGVMVVFVTKEGDVHLFDVDTGTVNGRLGIPQADGAGLIALSSNGAKLATIRRVQGEITIWDSQSRQQLQMIQSNGLSAVAFDSTGEQLGIANENGVEFWKLKETGFEKQGIMPIKDQPRRPGQLLFSPTGEYLAVMPRLASNALEVWNLPANSVVECPLNDGPRDRAMAFSSDGALITYVDDNPIQMWDIAMKTKGIELIDKLNRLGSGTKSHVNGTKTIAFSLDDSVIASSGQSLDGLTLWDSASGELKHQRLNEYPDQTVFWT